MGMDIDYCNVLTEIKNNYNSFTKSGRKIADYVLNNVHQVLFMSITDLADACNVGDTSVFRFCRTLKLKGYQEFKMLLSLGLDSPNGSAKSEYGIFYCKSCQRPSLCNTHEKQGISTLINRLYFESCIF